MYVVALHILKFSLSLFGRLKVYHKEKLPREGGFVIACTHTGWVDILWLGISIWPIKIYYMAKKELFQTRSMAWLMHQLNAFPVDRKNPGPSSLKIPHKLLKEGKTVGIFPSGTRTSEEVPLKRGAVTIAMRSNVPIVPAVYIGPNNFSDLFRKTKPRIIFGNPIMVPEHESRDVQLEMMMNELNDQLKTLHHIVSSKS